MAVADVTDGEPKDESERINRRQSVDKARQVVHDPLWRLHQGLPVQCTCSRRYPKVDDLGPEKGDRTRSWRVHCGGCRLEAFASTRMDAVDSWNRKNLRG